MRRSAEQVPLVFLVLHLPGREAGSVPLEEPFFDIGEVRGRRQLASLPPPEPLPGPTQKELSPGPSDPDMEQAALLVQNLPARLAPGEREKPALAAGDEHHGELEPLRRMEGQQRDAIGTSFSTELLDGARRAPAAQQFPLTHL